MRTPTLETPRLWLRPVAQTDVPAIQKHFDHPEVIGNLSSVVPWPYPPDGAQQWVDRVLPQLEAGRIHIWVLVEKAGSDEAIGVIDYRPTPNAAGHRGFWLARPWWGQGLMTEATWAMQDWVFLELGAEELIVCNAASNLASRRLKEKSGAEMIDEIDLPHHHGSNRTERWRLTAEAWARFRSPAARG
jgi:ribosomal-protein-alanine N-acetyltransferase